MKDYCKSTRFISLNQQNCPISLKYILKTIQQAIIPLLPLYIFGIFLGMTFTGEAYHIIVVFAKIICIIFILHIVILAYEFLIAGGLSRKNPLRLLLNMMPAYFTALGTSSSAATIPSLHPATGHLYGSGSWCARRSSNGSTGSTGWRTGLQSRRTSAHHCPLHRHGLLRYCLQCHR